jgi:hypothetical protein
MRVGGSKTCEHVIGDDSAAYVAQK